ncbi:MAG: hypothetical protein WA231_13425 [Methylocella sp.]
MQEEGKTDPERLRQLAAVRFYLQYVIWQCEIKWEDEAKGPTNYVTVLDQLRRVRAQNEPVLLVTFNYDRMIETALSSVGLSISELQNYIQNDAFKLFKLHGSVHWAHEIENQVINVSGRNVWDVVHELINTAPNLNISSRFRIVDGYPTGKVDDIPLFPAIALPVETKLDFECPPDHLECLRAHLGKITKVLTVGWAAQERHFLTLLKENLSREIHVKAVAGTEQDGEQVLDRIRGAGISLVAERPVAGFTEYVISRDAEQFFCA